MECKDGVCFIKPKGKSSKKVPLLPNNKEWTVYGAEWCPFCKQAKSYLEKKDAELNYIDVDLYGGSGNVKEQLKNIINGQNTIPIIFHYEKLIGGYSDLRLYYPTLKMSKLEGFSQVKQPDNETQKIANLVKDQFEERVEKCYEKFELVEYKTQVVTGINYLLNIKIGDDEHVHLRVFRDLSNNHTLTGHLHPKKSKEELEVFNKN